MIKERSDLIAEREQDSRIKNLKEKGYTLYSFSRLSTMETCPYAAYLQYIAHEENQTENIWAILGTEIHDALEQLTNKKMSCDKLPEMLSKALTSADILGVTFPKDMNGGDSIKNNWIKSMMHFCKNFKGLPGKFKTEELAFYHTEFDKYLMGYIDLIRYNEDGTVSVLDWKTSSVYKGRDLEEHAHQLAVYSMALEQVGYKVRDMAWIFLKYCKITFWGKKRSNAKEKTWITKVVERGKIGKELEKYFRADLEELGVGCFKIDEVIDQIKETSDLNYLPEELRANYKVEDYILTIPYDEEQKELTKEFVNKQIEEFERRSNNPNEWEHREFYKVGKNGKKYPDTFFCNNLCNFCKSCKYILEFNDSLDEKEKEPRRKTNPQNEFKDMFDLLG